MRNRILSITRNIIPYIRELQPLTGSVSGCIVMQQLDYWFERYPDGFWKFLEPSNHSMYKRGDSWSEELGMSAEEFRTAFDRLGVRHKSKSLFDAAPDKFQRKFYCSYLDRRENLTYYFRNHDLVDRALEQLISTNRQVAPVNGECRFTGNHGDQFPQVEKSDIQEIVNPHFTNTETSFSETTQIPLPHTKTSDSSGRSFAFGHELKIEPAIAPFLPQLMAVIQHGGISGLELVQDLLDELAGNMEAGARGDREKIGNPVIWLQSVVTKGFVRTRCIEVQSRRRSVAAYEQRKAADSDFVLDARAQVKGQELLANLSRKRLIKSAKLTSEPMEE